MTAHPDDHAHELDQLDPRLAALWHAARPVEPSADAWNAVWARISDRLDQSAEVETTRKVGFETLAMPAGRWQRFGFVAASLAQAAAILVAVSLALQPRPGAPRVHLAAAAWHPVDIEPGESLLIHADGRLTETFALASAEGTGVLSVDAQFEMFNAIESMAETLQ